MFRFNARVATAATVALAWMPPAGLAQSPGVSSTSAAAANTPWSIEFWLHALARADSFWENVWSIEYTSGSGMTLSETEAPDTWSVYAMDGRLSDPVVAVGQWVEAVRLPLVSMAYTPAELDGIGVLSFDRFVVAGTIAGSTQQPFAAAGVVAEITLDVLEDQGSPVVIRTFGAFGLEDSEAVAIDRAIWYWESIEQPGDPGSPRTSGRDCEEEERLCKQAAELRYSARNKIILAATYGTLGTCGAACLASGPGWFVCQSACSALALLAEAVSLSASADQYNADLADCERQRIQCEAAE